MQNRAEQIYNELLVIKCKQGDSGAFDQLVAKWQRRLWNYAYKVTGSDSKGGGSGERATTFKPKTWYRLSMSFKSNIIKVKIDDKEIASVGDQACATGLAGLGGGTKRNLVRQLLHQTDPLECNRLSFDRG